jgi:hypothetical protein
MYRGGRPAHSSSFDRLLQIGEVAERVGLSLRAVRFHEEADLLVPVGRRAASGSTTATRSTGSS